MIGLDERAHKAVQLRHVHAAAQLAQRFGPRAAQLDVAEGLSEFGGQRAVAEFSCDPRQGFREIKSRLHGDGEEVQRVRQVMPDLILATMDAAAQPEDRPIHPGADKGENYRFEL